MNDRIALIRQDPPTRVMIYSLVLGLGCLAGGCGGEPSADTAPSEVPAGIKGMKENLKSQIQLQKGAKGKRQPSGAPG
jgi:hypothetical protein